MKDFPLPLTANEWMRQMFVSKTALNGGVVRRKISDVDRIVGRDAFFDAMRKGASLNCPADDAFASCVTVLKVNEAIAAKKMLTFAPDDFKV